jgi:hypothetical protein
MTLKTFQLNNMQKHGNFDAMLTTVMTEESEQSNQDEPKQPEDLNIVKFELDVSIPSFEVEVMKLKLVPGLN